jgi:hypothetical protein
MPRLNIARGLGSTDVAIVGAGPYGLSIGAHLREAGVDFRLFGEPMHSWRVHMPGGMHLKSEGFASNIYDPRGSFTLEKFCADKGIPYAHSGLPISLGTFTAYGMAFQERLLPSLERRKVVELKHENHRFALRFDDGETVTARNVVLAVGIGDFARMPPELAGLTPELVSHSSRHADLTPWRGRSIAVVGGGSSAIDLAYLLHEAGAGVHLVARRQALRFHMPPTGEQRSRWQQIRYPITGMGPGLRARLYTDAPLMFHLLPRTVRRNIVLNFAPPEGGWFSRKRLMGRVPLLLGYSIVGAEPQRGQIDLHLRGQDGSQQRMTFDHIIAATGYEVDLAKLTFLSGEMRSSIRSAYRTPLLSSAFESSIKGLYFAGLPSALSFGPMMRFALGAGYTARVLTRSLKQSQSPHLNHNYVCREVGVVGGDTQ